MAWLDCVSYWRAWHTLRVIVLIYWGIQLGHVDGTSRSTVLKLEGLKGSQNPGQSHRQSMIQAQASSRSLYDKAKNQLHVGLLVLLNRDLQRMCLIAAELCKFTREWQGQQRRGMHTAAEVQGHYGAEANGAFLDPLRQTVGAVYDAAALSRMFFLVSPADA
eukprot:3547027-Lingulodinium_polyedra.AAC.1